MVLLPPPPHTPCLVDEQGRFLDTLERNDDRLDRSWVSCDPNESLPPPTNDRQQGNAMTDSTSLCEPERRKKLLDCLRCGLLSDVPGTLLRDPQPGTRPHVKLVAHLPRLWQVFLRHVPMSEGIRLVVGAPFGVGLLLLWTTTVAPRLRDLGPWGELVNFVAWMVVGAGFYLLALNLRGRFACTWDTPLLDLNELRCVSPDGPRHVPWREVYTVSLGVMNWVRVELENGVVVLIRVPRADRDWLVDAMKELIRHHHGDLHGTMPKCTSNDDPDRPRHATSGGEAKSTSA